MWIQNNKILFMVQLAIAVYDFFPLLLWCGYDKLVLIASLVNLKNDFKCLFLMYMHYPAASWGTQYQRVLRKWAGVSVWHINTDFSRSMDWVIPKDSHSQPRHLLLQRVLGLRLGLLLVGHGQNAALGRCLMSNLLNDWLIDLIYWPVGRFVFTNST